MASYRSVKGSWDIRWSYQGKSYSKCLLIPVSLKKESETLARERSEEIQLFISKLESGLVQVPPDCHDLRNWLFTAGRSGAKDVKLPSTLKLRKMIDWFKGSLTWSDYEEKTKQTATVHFKHFIRLIGNIPVIAIGTNEIQNYINKRAKEPTRRGNKVKGNTIKKELGTLSAIWNAAHTEELIPTLYQEKVMRRQLKYPKVDALPPFQTIEQVEAQVCLMKSKVELAELWGSLFLRMNEQEQLLEDVRNRNGNKWKSNRCRWLDCMVATAIYTGARRSELMRLTVADLDFSKKEIRVREKKKTNAVTYRHVPMHPKLSRILGDYLVKENKLSGLLFCRRSGKPIPSPKAYDILKTALKGTRWENIRGWHLFRHSFISNLACKCIPESAIETWAGHLDPETRKRYQHLFPEYLTEQFAKAFA